MDPKIIIAAERKSKPLSMPPPPPPPLPPPPTKWAARQVAVSRSSVTLEEIARFWRRKKMEEEDHLLAAQKAAARIRARNLTEEDYKRFEESLEDRTEEKKQDESMTEKDDTNKELRVGIKDWWTKSKYAYLNQPAVQSMADHHPRKRASTYIPNMCLFQAPPPQSTASLGFCR